MHRAARAAVRKSPDWTQPAPLKVKVNEEDAVNHERLVETILKAGKALVSLSHLGRRLEVYSLKREKPKICGRKMLG